MQDLFLKDILNLSDKDLSKAKIALNMKWDGKYHFQIWEETGDVTYSYHSRRGQINKEILPM